MMEWIKRVFALKIRKRPRYRVKKGAYVALSSTPGKYQIDDIGVGGLSFHYIDRGTKPKYASQEIKISSENGPSPVHLAGRIVADSETGELIFERKKIKRRSIRFDTMSSQTRRELEAFIRECTETRL